MTNTTLKRGYDFLLFLPATIQEVRDYTSELDFILVTGDAYVDHPSFGSAVIGRLLESKGYKVAILAQPDFKNAQSFKIFGKPRLAFLVTSGNIDSMVNHYTVAKKKRKKDSYSPDGRAGCRPDRATIVYSQRIREAYGDVPIILGGIEASLRRLSHYDYWDNNVRRSILIDSQADMITYGMAEHQIVQIAEALDSGIPVEEITFIKGTVFKTRDITRVYDYIELCDYERVSTSKEEYAKSFFIQYKNTDSITAKTLVERYNNVYVVQNTPSEPLSTSEFDYSYGLKYTREPHPMYDGMHIPAIEEVKFSIISNRGCFGNCNFCALGFHQGRVIQTRSHKSILNEARLLTYDKDFKGYIHDVGGPTANFRSVACDKQLKHGVCSDKQCLFPKPCKNLKIDHSDYLSILRQLRELPNIKKVFVRSGIRYDYLIHDTDETFFTELCEHHISGQLKVAPEHISEKVLNKMGKPSKGVYEKFCNKYSEINKKLGMNQFIVPYLMSSHPGSDLKSAIELACYLRDLGHMPEQVQDFYPTPGTLSTCMYYTELDPRTMEKVYVAKSNKDKTLQRALMQYRLPQNYDLVLEALSSANRKDLIGFDKKCLIRPKFKPKSKDTENFKKKKTIRKVHKKKK